MEGGKELYSPSPGQALTSDPGDGCLLSQEGLGGYGSQGADDLGLDSLNLFQKEGKAGLDLLGLGSSIPWRSAFEDVGDVHLISGETNPLEELSEELTCLSHKGSALEVFLPPGGLAYKHELGMGVSLAKDQVVSGFPQGTPLAVPQ